MDFKEMIKENNLQNDLDKYKKDNEITYNLECAVAELILNEGSMDMFKELKDNGDPSELVAEFLEREESKCL
jgi:Glu-tRNA(Gln) amidotransferase subunit E-like FAD-binding protein